MAKSVIGSWKETDSQMHESYDDLLQANGKPLFEAYPGSTQVALSADKALRALDFLQAPVAGGDVLLIDDSGQLAYAYRVIGEEYHVLNWHCDKEKDEERDEYRVRSHEIAEEAIQRATEVLAEFEKECYVVLVTS